jgi:hypothetical protein
MQQPQIPVEGWWRVIRVLDEVFVYLARLHRNHICVLETRYDITSNFWGTATGKHKRDEETEGIMRGRTFWEKKGGGGICPSA